MRLLALATATALVTALLPTSAAGVGPISDLAPTRSASTVTLEGDPEPLFVDVPFDHPFATEIGWLIDEGITTGYADGTFRPTGTISRQAFAAFLYRLDGQSDDGACAPGEDAFSDVPASHPFCREITWLADSGISTGYADGTFRPGATISRQALSAFLHRYDHPGTTAAGCEGDSPFSDVPASSPFCEAIRWMSGVGITTGYSDGTFGPGRTASRQAMAAYLFRYREYRPAVVDRLYYEVAAGTVETAPGDVLDVVVVAEEPDLDDPESQDGPLNWSATVLFEAGTAPETGQAVVVPPGDPVHPNGLAGVVDSVEEHPDGTVVTLAPVPLDEVFDVLEVEYSGPLGDGYLGGSGGTGEPEGAMAGALAPQALAAASAPAASGPLFQCRDEDGYVVGLDVGTSTFDLDVQHLRGTFIVDIKPLHDPIVSLTLTAEPVVSVSAEVTVGVDCKALPSWQNAHRKVVPVGASGATLSVGPTFALSVDAGVKLDLQQRMYWTGGFQTNSQGRLEPVGGSSADTVEYQLSGGVTASVDAGLQIQLGYFDRVGVYGKVGPILSGTAELRYPAGVDPYVCLAYDLSLAASLGAYLDVWVARWEHEVLEVAWQVFAGELCQATVPGPGNPGGGDPGDPGDPGEPEVPEGPLTAVSTSLTHSLAVTETGQVLSWGYRGAPIAVVPGVSNAVDVAAGNGVSFAVTEDGDLLVWSVPYGDLGYWEGRRLLGMATSEVLTPTAIPTLSDVVDVAVGPTHALAVTGSGEVYAWGRTSQCELGQGQGGTELTLVSPQQVEGVTDAVRVAAGDGQSYALSSTGLLIGWGNSNRVGAGWEDACDPVLVPVGDPVVDVAVGEHHTLVARRDGTVHGWGWNSSGELGDGTPVGGGWVREPVQVPGVAGVIGVAAGEKHSAAVTTAGVVRTWGGNDAYQLGDGTTTLTTVPQTVAGVTNASAVVAGRGYTLALTEAGLSVWGANGDGQLGLTTRARTPTPIGLAAVDVAAGDDHSLALTEAGEVYAWGQNWSGQLGDGTTVPYRRSPAQVDLPGPASAISALTSRSLAVVAGEVYWWGASWDPSVPTRVDGLPGNVTDAVTGADFGLALTTDGAVYAWGSNASGELGNGRPEYVREVAAPVPGLTDVVAIAANACDALALTASGTVLAWGDWTCGNPGNGDAIPQLEPVQVPGLSGVTAIDAHGGASYAMTAGATYTWGATSYRLGLDTFTPTTLPLAAESVGGGWNVTFWIVDGEVYAFGSDDEDVLGLGDRIDRPDPVPIGLTATAITGGERHSVAVHDGEVYAWGRGYWGQLGLAVAPPEFRTPIIVYSG